jgi:hypothetical protein
VINSKLLSLSNLSLTEYILIRGLDMNRVTAPTALTRDKEWTLFTA